MVDDDDYEYLNKWHWWFNGRYAIKEERYGKRSENKKRKYYMHRFLMGAKEGQEVDHINSDKLDNRRENLRLCTRIENAHNKSIQSNNTSGYKGVYWSKAARKWQAYVTIDRKAKYLGLFEDKKDAARAYNQAALNNYGEFAKLNEVTPASSKQVVV